jgi:hypothetical protein
MEWTDEVKEIIELKKAKRLEIQAELNKLVAELRTKLMPTKVEMGFKNDDLLKWKIIIGEVSIDLEEKDVDRSRVLFGDNGMESKEQKDLSEALKGLILTLFKQKI